MGRASSSVGRACASHAQGHVFDSRVVHSVLVFCFRSLPNLFLEFYGQQQTCVMALLTRRIEYIQGSFCICMYIARQVERDEV